MTRKTNQVYCATHEQTFNKDSVPQKEHESNSKEKCKFVKHDPKKYNPDYKKSKISKQNKKKKFNGNNDGEESEPKSTRKVYDFAISKIIKLRRNFDDTNKVYALITAKDHYKTLELGYWESRLWLKSTYEQSTGEFYNDDVYKNALSLIIAHAITDEIRIEKIHNRIAFVGDEIFYDLANDKWELVKITKDENYSIVPMNDKTPLFRRTSINSEQLKPKPNSRIKNPLDDLVTLLRIPNEYRQLFKIHLVSFFIEPYPMPIFVIHGE